MWHDFNVFLTVLPPFVKLDFLWLLKHRGSVKHSEKASEEPLKLASFTETISCPLFLCLLWPTGTCFAELLRIIAHTALRYFDLFWGKSRFIKHRALLALFFFFSRSLTCCRPRVCDEFPLLEIKQWLQLARNQIHTVWLDYTLHLDDADFILSCKSVLYSNVTKYIRNIINKNFKIGVTK